MRVTEIFGSIQGEGQYIGVPSTFVRFYGCSMGCKNCDTESIGWKELRNIDILQEVHKLNNKHVVITGGEPFEQNLSDFIELVQLLTGEDYIITIETSGIIYDQSFITSVENKPILLSISPKLKCLSGREEGLELFTDTVGSYMKSFCDIQLKFVVNDKDDIEEVAKWLNNFNCHGTEIIFQPLYNNHLYNNLIYAEGGRRGIENYFESLQNLYKDIKTTFDMNGNTYRILPQYHKLLRVQ